jgi:hypothetical protein
MTVEVKLSLGKREGGQRLDRIAPMMDDGSPVEVIRLAYQMVEWYQERTGRLFIKDEGGGFEEFEMPPAPHLFVPPKREFCIGISEAGLDKLKELAAPEGGDLDAMTERALLFLERVIDGLQLFEKNDDGEFDPAPLVSQA